MTDIHLRGSWFFSFILLVAITPFSLQLRALPIGEGLQPLELASQQEEYVLYQQGRKKYAAGELEAADALYHQSLQANPIFFPAMIGLADIAFAQQDKQAAREHLDAALEAAPDSAIVHSAWGRFYYANGEYTLAEAALKKAIGLNAKMPEPHIELASLYLLRMNRLEDAASEYRTAIELQPDNLELYYGLSTALARQKKTDQAISVLDQAGKKQPDNPGPWQLKGSLLSGDGRLEEAIDAFRKTLSIDPDFAPAHWALGNIFLAQQDFDKALDAYNQVIRINPDSAHAYAKKGLVYQLQGSYEPAEEAYLMAVKIDPELSLAYNNLAYGAAERGDRLDKALAWANRAVALEPANPLYLDTLGWLYQQQGDLEMAKETLEKATDSKAAPPDVYYHLGIVNSDLGNAISAKRNFKKALSMSTQFEGASDAAKRLKQF